MIPALIIAAVLCLVIFWPVHPIVRYREGKAWIYVRILGLFRINILKPQKEKKSEKKAPAKQEKKEETEDKKAPEKSLSDKLEQFGAIIRIVLRTLERFCKDFKLYRCKVYVLVAGEDPATVAVEFGSVNAVVYGLLAFLEEKIRVGKKDIRIFYDYNKERPYFDIEFRFRVILLKFAVMLICVNWRDLLSLIRSAPSK